MACRSHALMNGKALLLLIAPILTPSDFRWSRPQLLRRQRARLSQPSHLPSRGWSQTLPHPHLDVSERRFRLSEIVAAFSRASGDGEGSHEISTVLPVTSRTLECE